MRDCDIYTSLRIIESDLKVGDSSKASSELSYLIKQLEKSIDWDSVMI
jgi:hypothetical protein